jgi:two-component system cell cycle sensor histidine kinase/response regulator CckA
VLVVDDEDLIRHIERRTLEGCGYLVTEAASGTAAIESLADGRPLDLLIADLEMPQMTGGEMVRLIRATRPDLKVLYVTGNIDPLMDERTLWEGEAYLEKPFTGTALREAVALLLHGTLQNV